MGSEVRAESKDRLENTCLLPSGPVTASQDGMTVDSKKNIWIVTDGSQGMISQANGLAQQLSARIFNIKIDLIFPWSILEPGFLPGYRWIFKNKIDI